MLISIFKYISLITILFSVFSCQNDQEKIGKNTYNVSKENSIYSEMAQAKYDSGDYKEAISMNDKINTNGVFSISKFMDKAKSFAKLGINDSSLVNIRKAVKVGADSFYFDKVLFEDIYKEIEYSYAEDHRIYLNSINVDLRKELLEMTKLDQYVRIKSLSKDETLKVDSINLVKLDSIVNIHGWPSSSLIGRPSITEQVNPSLIIIHSDKAINIKYLDIIKESCDKGDENWFVLGSIVSNLLFRHSTIVEPVPFYYLQIDEDSQKIDTMQSEFILDFISSSLNHNKSYDLHLFPTENIEKLPNRNLLEDLTFELVNRGLARDRIHIHQDQIIQSDSDSSYIYMTVDYEDDSLKP